MNNFADQTNESNTRVISIHIFFVLDTCYRHINMTYWCIRLAAKLSRALSKFGGMILWNAEMFICTNMNIHHRHVASFPGLSRFYVHTRNMSAR